MSDLYSNNLELTSQFRFCGNAFRIDTYRGCDFGCKYCFANNRNGSNFEGKINNQIGDITVIENWFKKINDGKNYDSINVELLRKKVPLHLGGMADPFQSREFEYEVTYKLLQLSKKYNYPMVISTKQCELPEKYFDFLDPKIHAFQISLIYFDCEKTAKLETNTPTPQQRINFIKLLKSKGFWVSVRIQPLVNLEQAEKILNECANYIDYCTIEHLKLPKMNDKVWKQILDCLDNEYKLNLRATPDKPEFEVNNFIKLKNVNYLKGKFKNVKFGCGDNDIHEYSDSLNCCGVDTMPESFNNWLKYNSMYLKMTNDKTQWYPQKNCASCLNSASRKNGFNFKNYVDDYHLSKYGTNEQMSLF